MLKYFCIGGGRHETLPLIMILRTTISADVLLFKRDEIILFAILAIRQKEESIIFRENTVIWPS